ncbi:MAG: site-specific DNA-methyltransferase [Chlorobi bacterium]|nr:site-specific DNA-methyltransferase [Chlorobiota bacterium]
MSASVGTIVLADNLDVLRTISSDSVDLIYIDPPFNTGKQQQRVQLRTEADPDGDRIGFGDKRYRTTVVARHAYEDSFDDYLEFLRPRLEEARRILAPHGSLYLHCDYREAHYIKILLDRIFGRDAFINEIIWAYDYGGRSKRRWPAKHDTIFFYAKDPDRYFFDADAVERIPYMAPDLVGPEKAARGKLPTDVWWHTIVPTNSREKTGYPTQKPLGILRRIIQASSRPGDLVLDFFAGSGTTGYAAWELGRRFLLVDNNPDALAIMAQRFAQVPDVEWVNFDPTPYRAADMQASLFHSTAGTE